MADILDDLEGILGKEAADKIRSAPLATRLQRGDSVREYYDGDMSGDPPPPAKKQEHQQERQESRGGESLADVLGELNKVTTRLGDLPKTIHDEVDKVVTAKGNELFSNVLAASMRNNRELSKIDSRHRTEFGEDLDDSKLEAHADAAAKAGRPFRTITEAYEDMTREARLEKRIATGVETGVREKLKERNNSSLPGVSSTGGSPMLRALKAVPSAGGNASAVSKAARALDERLAERGEAVA